jgi:hypothetical protein
VGDRKSGVPECGDIVLPHYLCLFVFSKVLLADNSILFSYSKDREVYCRIYFSSMIFGWIEETHCSQGSKK